ncbi:MAG: hypothetical protein AAF542_22790 [Pseudomonadota bacterium]
MDELKDDVTEPGQGGIDLLQEFWKQQAQRICEAPGSERKWREVIRAIKAKEGNTEPSLRTISLFAGSMMLHDVELPSFFREYIAECLLNLSDGMPAKQAFNSNGKKGNKSNHEVWIRNYCITLNILRLQAAGVSSTAAIEQVAGQFSRGIKLIERVFYEHKDEVIKAYVTEREEHEIARFDWEMGFAYYEFPVIPPAS